MAELENTQVNLEEILGPPPTTEVSTREGESVSVPSKVNSDPEALDLEAILGPPPEESFNESGELRVADPVKDWGNVPIEITDQEVRDFQYTRFAENLSVDMYGEEGLREMALGQKRLKFFMRRAPRIAMAFVAPIVAAGYEVLDQVKNFTISRVKEEEYDPMVDRMISEFVPESAPTPVKIVANLAEVLVDVAIVGGLMNLAKKGLLLDAVKEVDIKLQQAGRPITGLSKQDILKAAEGTTVEKAAKAYVGAKGFKVKLKGDRLLQGPVPGESSVMITPMGQPIEVKGINKMPVKGPGATDSGIYQQVYDLKPIPSAIGRLSEVSNRTLQNISNFIDTTFVPISTRLSKISDSLKHAVRKFEFGIKLQTSEDLKAVKPFLEKYSKLSPKAASDLDYALKIGDRATADSIMAANGMTKAFEKTTEVLAGIFERANKFGLDVEYLKEYFPRKIKDYQSFLDFVKDDENWAAMQEAIKAQEAELGVEFNDVERAEFINSLFSEGSFERLKTPGGAKSRQVTNLTPQLNTFYKNSSQALIDYIEGMNSAIETRKFLGQSETDIDKSIGKYVNDLIASGEIGRGSEQQVRDIIKARLSEKGTSGFVTVYKNMAYIYSMGSPINALTQLGDMAFSLYKNGFMGTLNCLFMRGKVKKSDIGIERIAEEFAGSSTSGKAVTTVFKAIGLDVIDRLGKETFINGALQRLSKNANANPEATLGELEVIFGDGAAQVLADLKAGNVTDDVKYLMFSELADVQPIALSELPEKYLTGGNARLFYMLKSFTLKAIDVYHNEVFRNLKTDPVNSFRNLVKLTFAFAAVGASVDWIKDFIQGKKQDLSDYVVNNMVKVLSLSKYQVVQAKKEGLVRSFLESLLPPVPWVDDVIKDVVKGADFKDWKTLEKIPGAGKLYYWWFGGGKTKKKEEKKKAKKKRTLGNKKKGKKRRTL